MLVLNNKTKALSQRPRSGKRGPCVTPASTPTAGSYRRLEPAGLVPAPLGGVLLGSVSPVPGGDLGVHAPPPQPPPRPGWHCPPSLAPSTCGHGPGPGHGLPSPARALLSGPQLPQGHGGPTHSGLVGRPGPAVPRAGPGVGGGGEQSAQGRGQVVTAHGRTGSGQGAGATIAQLVETWTGREVVGVRVRAVCRCQCVCVMCEWTCVRVCVGVCEWYVCACAASA